MPQIIKQPVHVIGAPQATFVRSRRARRALRRRNRGAIAHPNVFFGAEEDLVQEAQSVVNEGGQIVDQASLVADQTVPLRGSPRATIMLTAAAAGVAGAMAGKPVAGALIGAALGWFAHRTWMG